MKRIAVFASGNGSNFQAILDANKSGALNARIALLVCDRSDAFAIERAGKEGVPAFVFNPENFFDKAAYESDILEYLETLKIDFIALAGYMRLVGSTLLEKYEGRIVNIHPSLLPEFPGKDAIGQALTAAADKTGATVHFVDSGMDTGQIIAQESVTIEPGETRETLQKKIQQIEHTLYPAVIEKLLNGTKETIQ
ncbi:phosphoribosylglycinamide formyltransferase [Mesobacillus foraminis]|uniref:phosphoribosylglycinamide formyltransferase n=1 Tax=Mesobacillus foraminis TaxID=279826 RepID=UPI000EF50968|nr:phosphoribosylglycinamide formyltransferase [Mesobacillus foraminis]